MIINMHSHLIHKNMWSENFFKAMVKVIAKALNQPEAVIEQVPIPSITNANAENYVKAMDDTGIDKGLVMGLDLGLSSAGEAKWSIEEKQVINCLFS